MATTATTGGQQPANFAQQARLFVRTYLRGAGQVMFQCSSWTGLLFLIGIFWGSYQCHVPQVAWGALVGTLASTLAGYAMRQKNADGDEGLWGFNGILVGCAFPTFLPNNAAMWLALIFFAALTTWTRQGFNNVMAPWKVNSLTFPFVFLTWVFLLCSRIFDSLHPVGLSDPGVVDQTTFHLDMGIGNLAQYWLKGVSQVFLVNSWVTGILFLVGLWLCNKWAAIYGALGSAIALALAIFFEANPSDIANGLFGFSPVLTAIAIGMTFYQVNWRSFAWMVVAVIATFFIQAGMDVLMEPWGLPTLTGPFCLATWIFLLPLYRLGGGVPDHSRWRAWVKDEQAKVDDDLNKDIDKL